MARQTLQLKLSRLREQLKHAHDLDHDTRRELAEIAETIDEVLEADAPDYQSAHKRIENSALEFEARHPAFARILSDVTDALAKLGF
jgi:hypothetical protein